MIPQEDGIVVSATEPIKNRRRIWLRKGKNLYNPETMPLMNGLWISGTENIINNTGGWYVIVPISGGETYTVSKKNTRTDFSSLNFTLVTTETYPENNVDILQISSGSSYLNEYTITAQASAKYLFIGLAIGATLTDDMKIKAIEELMIEVGSPKTDYEAFIDPTIYVKNENGIYEEFIKKEGKVAKYGSITNPDETAFQITHSRVIQVENTVYVDLTVKILKQISSNNQYNFAINGVKPPKVTTFVFGSYGSNEYTHTSVLYVYVFQNTCYINNVSMNSAVNGYWKIHFVYNVD